MIELMLAMQLVILVACKVSGITFWPAVLIATVSGAGFLFVSIWPHIGDNER